MKDIGNPTCVVVVPGQSPFIEYGDPWEVFKRYSKDAFVEMIRYPAQYNRKNSFVVFADEEALLKPTAYNRWGLANVFVVTKRNAGNDSFMKLLEDDVTKIFADLIDAEGGYLVEESNVSSAFREMKKVFGVLPPGFPCPSPNGWVS